MRSLPLPGLSEQWEKLVQSDVKMQGRPSADVHSLLGGYKETFHPTSERQ